MRKVIIHIEQITKPLEKFSFQVKIPQGANELRSVHVSANAPVNTIGSDSSPTAIAGDLVMGIPREREHFYTESVRVVDTQVDRLRIMASPGMSRYNDQWIQGTMGSFFGITVKAENTIIEGFYQSRVQWNYELKIYLEFDV